MTKNKAIIDVESKEDETCKHAKRQFRNAQITGRTVLTVGKYALIVIGAATLINAMTKDDTTNQELTEN